MPAAAQPSTPTSWAGWSLVIVVWLLLTEAGCRYDAVAIDARPGTMANHAPNPCAPHSHAPHSHAPYSSSRHISGERPGSWDPVRDTAPLTSRHEIPTEQWMMGLDEAIRIALSNTEILRSLNANAVNNPEFIASHYDPLLQATDPNFGLDAALALYDPQINSGLNFARNDDVFNNPVLGGGATEVRDDVTALNYGFADFGRNGTRFSIDGRVVHSDSTNPSLLFPGSWTTALEAAVRHPLLQGSGHRFNQLAGLANRPGFQVQSGIVISRISHDISIAQFETEVREMIREIIEAYWELERAYRDYRAIAQAADAAEVTWKIVKAKYDNDLGGGEADREAQAREQMFEFRSRLLVAKNGDARNKRNGLFQAEANLRRLLNLPQSDGRMIVPTDDAIGAEIAYNWSELAAIALDHRVELLEQSSRVTQRELELEIAGNFLMPRLDAVAVYRNNGFGSDLAFGGNGRFSSALDDATSFDHNEWEVGLVYDQPLGFRQARAGVRHAQLAVCREKAVLAEQQRQILHQLGTAVRQLDQSFEEIQLQDQRTLAAQNTVDARSAAYAADAVGFEDLLLAQQRLLEARLDYHRSLINFELARVQMVIESGQLFQEYNIFHFHSGAGDLHQLHNICW